MVWTRWKEYEIYSQSGEKEPRQKHVRKLRINGLIATDPFKILS